MLLDSADLATADLSSLASVVYDGSPMYRGDLIEALDRIGPVFPQLYAQGESPMTVTYLRREEHRPGRVDADVLSSAGVARTGMRRLYADPRHRRGQLVRSGHAELIVQREFVASCREFLLDDQLGSTLGPCGR